MRKPARPPSVSRLATLTPKWEEYELIDSGGGRKLERFGSVTLVRPEPQATWQPALDAERWAAAHGEFRAGGGGQRGEWKFAKLPPPRWMIQRKNLVFWVEATPSGHVGVFPDQAAHWDWIADKVAAAGRQVEMLSLFGHTGLATLSAAAAGAHVTHVDASHPAVKRARENQELSVLWDRPIRWIAEDAFKYVSREVRRGKRYNALVLDPPRFGRGPGGEIWKLETSLPALLQRCREVLSAAPLFVIINTYTTVVTRDETKADAMRLSAMLGEMLEGYSAKIQAGELALADSNGRKITQSIFARAEIRAS
jgi:23S rRNA (cytosine1962-C5)-methyltransferase